MFRRKIALICSSGGHFLELYTLNEAWHDHERFWVTFPGPDTDCILKGERVHHAFHPTNRHFTNFLRNLFLARRILRQEKPALIISSGAGVGVPFLLMGKRMGIPTLYIESLTFSESLSISGRLVYHFVDEFLVQWPRLCERYPKARYVGQVI